MNGAGISYNAKLGVLICLTLISLLITFVLRPVPQNTAYHHFADDRIFWQIPNFANVISNLPFTIIGAFGLIKLAGVNMLHSFKIIYAVLFTGIFMTGFGSAYYHFAPDNNTLIWDRMPMAIVFMAFLSATIAELINRRIGLLFLGPLIAFGMTAVLWWHHTELSGRGDLRWYGWVQFYPIIFIPVAMILFPSREYGAGYRSLILVVLWYTVAKLFEHFDREIYMTIHIISGHSLKHLAAAISCWYLLRLFGEKHAYC